MKKMTLLRKLVSLLTIIGMTSLVNASDQKNVLLIVVDDLGQKDIGFYGNEFYETVNIDRLAESGVAFTNGYAANPVCSPTRASIHTGINPARIGITDYHGCPTPLGAMKHKDMSKNKLLPTRNKEELDLETITLAEVFKDNGYATFFAGKWHLGPEGFWPEDQGFDVNIAGWSRGGPYGGKKYFSPYGNPRIEDGPHGEHLPDRLANETVKFIEQHRYTPFFACLSFYSVHTPIMSRSDLKAKYEAKTQGKKAPEFKAEDDCWSRQTVGDPTYAGMMEAMDLAVGKVLDALKETGLDKNTVIAFVSDNGALSTYPSKSAPTSTLPYRGGKGWLYEGGVRIPYILKAPGLPARINTDSLASTEDLFPTLLDLSGVEIPSTLELDGISLVDAMKGESKGRETIYFHYPHYAPQGSSPSSAVRQGNWKLIEQFEGGLELYDLDSDVSESHNLASKFPEKALELHEMLIEWRAEVGALTPTPNPLVQ